MSVGLDMGASDGLEFYSGQNDDGAADTSGFGGVGYGQQPQHSYGQPYGQAPITQPFSQPGGGWDAPQMGYGSDAAAQGSFSGSMDAGYAGSGRGAAPPMGVGSFSSSGGFQEPPLLDELGIDFYQIKSKTMSVLHPFSANEHVAVMAEADLAGPLVFCLLFGATMLASGRIQFGHIYGTAMLSCVFLYTVLNLMSDRDVSFSQVASVLGYALLPMVGLSAIGIVFALRSTIGGALALVCTSWCALAASKMFAMGLGMHDQRWLVAYPCLLLYGVFAMLSIF